MLKATKNTTIISALVIFALALGNAGSTLYLPALVQMTHALNASTQVMKLSLSIYLISFGVSQLFYGPLSDAFGRRINLMVGIAIFSIGNLITMLAPNVDVLLAGRLIEGLGMGTANAVGYAVMRDIYEGETLVRQLSYISIFVGFVPLLAPLIGGYLTEFIGWRACFGFLLLLSILLTLLKTFILPETNLKLSPTAHYPHHAIKNYYLLLKHRVILSSILLAGIGFSVLFVINAMLPFLLIKRLGLTVSTYGFLNAIIGIGYVSGAFWAGWYANKHGFVRALLLGMGVIAISALLGLFLGFFYFNIIVVVIPSIFVLLGAGFLVPLGASSAMTPFPKKAGFAAALLGAGMFSIASLFTAIASHLHEQFQGPMFIFLFLMDLLAILPLIMLKRSS